MIVSRIQEHLEAIYSVHCLARAADFLLTQEQASKLGATGRANEELLVAQSEDGESLEVGLYYAPGLLSEVGDGLDAELNAYCQVAEGVSHFVYLSQVAGRERRVSLLEMEVQGEIDKFVTCVLQRWALADAARVLHHRLFYGVGYIAGLEPHERARYEEANRVARNYCARLLVHVGARRMDRLLSELRYSYRLGADAKMRHLDR